MEEKEFLNEVERLSKEIIDLLRKVKGSKVEKVDIIINNANETTCKNALLTMRDNDKKIVIAFDVDGNYKVVFR